MLMWLWRLCKRAGKNFNKEVALRTKSTLRLLCEVRYVCLISRLTFILFAFLLEHIDRKILTNRLAIHKYKLLYPFKFSEGDYCALPFERKPYDIKLIHLYVLAFISPLEFLIKLNLAIGLSFYISCRIFH